MKLNSNFHYVLLFAYLKYQTTNRCNDRNEIEFCWFEKMYFNRRLSEWFQKTTWHGVLDMTTAKNCLTKLIWLIILLFSLLMIIMNVIFHIKDYIDGDKWTTITYFRENKNGVEFPKIIICNMNMASKQKLDWNH